MITSPVALIVGGSSGIGAATARALAASGYRTAIMSRSERALTLADEVGGFGFRGDNRSAADLEAFVGAAAGRFGRVDAVVNSSGHGASGPVLSLSDADWQEGMELYLLNVVRIARVATPHLRASGGGAIVNVSTSSPFEPNPRYPVSATMRSALATFTKLYADQHGPDGIRMNNVLPGWTVADPHSVPTEYTEKIPLRRTSSFDDQAAVIRFLVSSDASYITGQNIRVDGGASRSV